MSDNGMALMGFCRVKANTVSVSPGNRHDSRRRFPFSTVLAPDAVRVLLRAFGGFQVYLGLSSIEHVFGRHVTDGGVQKNALVACDELVQ